jgi:hypothetical protein
MYPQTTVLQRPLVPTSVIRRAVTMVKGRYSANYKRTHKPTQEERNYNNNIESLTIHILPFSRFLKHDETGTCGRLPGPAPNETWKRAKPQDLSEHQHQASRVPAIVRAVGIASEIELTCFQLRMQQRASLASCLESKRERKIKSDYRHKHDA